MKMPSERPRSSRARLALRMGQRQPAQVVALARQYVEGVELHLRVVLAGMQATEVGDAVDAQEHRLAIDHCLSLRATSTIHGNRFV
ncbi:hypothetical protein ACT4MK_00150 (plasmid) [Bradyrhizobium barranii]|uniref:hypothetical protein n=1 Tax=Bradyrhizobium barranii TaxID=2992140 RepID=UPI0040331DB6